MATPGEDGSVAVAREKSRQALYTARRALKSDDADGAVNRAYYAVFYFASAALHLVGERPKTHKGVADRFWVRFVKGGPLTKESGRTLRTAFAARQKADYDLTSIYDTAAASDLLADVEVFCEAAEALLDDLLEDRTGGE